MGCNSCGCGGSCGCGNNWWWIIILILVWLWLTGGNATNISAYRTCGCGDTSTNGCGGCGCGCNLANPTQKREPKGSLFFMQHYSSFAGKGTIPFSIRSVIAATAPCGILRCASIMRLRMAALPSSRRTAERVSRTLSVPSAIP